jgi:hypothetical protein
VLVLSDHGRARPAPLAIAEPGARYFADILGTGELKYTAIHLSMLNTAGHRLLGIQVAQALALARLAAAREGTRQIHAVADGWNAGFVLTLAAALEPKRFESCTVYVPLLTLRYLMDWPLRYEDAQSLLCPDLLTVADVPQIRSLMEGVEFRSPGRCAPAAAYGRRPTV